MIVASFTLAVGQSTSLNVSGVLACVAGAGPVTVDVGGRSVVLPADGSGGAYVAGSLGGQVPVYGTPDPVTSIARPKSKGMPRTAANLALAASNPSANVALCPPVQAVDVPTGYVAAPPVAVLVSVTAGTGSYSFQVSQ